MEGPNRGKENAQTHCFQRPLNERNVSIINCFHLLHLFANNIALFKTFASIKLLSLCTQSSRLSVYSPLLKDFERRMQRREWRTRHLHNASKAHHKILARTIACVNNLALPWMKIKGMCLTAPCLLPVLWMFLNATMQKTLSSLGVFQNWRYFAVLAASEIWGEFLSLPGHQKALHKQLVQGRGLWHLGVKAISSSVRSGAVDNTTELL